MTSIAPATPSDRLAGFLGFNQAAEIVRHAARHLGLPLRAGLLRRPQDTPAQSGLGALDRRTNLQGAFAATESPPARVARIDDVLRTGGTAAEAARVLKAAGAARLEVWVAARTLLGRLNALAAG